MVQKGDLFKNWWMKCSPGVAHWGRMKRAPWGEGLPEVKKLQGIQRSVLAGWPSGGCGGGGGGGAVLPVGRRGPWGGSAHGVSESVWLVAGKRRQEAGDASTGEDWGETGFNPVQRQKQQIGKNTQIRARRLNYHRAVSDTIWQPMKSRPR